MQGSPGNVLFDVLVRAPASGRQAHLENIDQFRPSPESIEQCRRWLSAQGVIVHATEFGLACSASRELFERLFKVQLTAQAPKHGEPSFEMTENPKLPPEIADLIEQITLTRLPELF